MKKLPTSKQINKAKQISLWDFGNKILYDLCRKNFRHVKDEHILTKALFIGRIYAAAIERRKAKTENINDDFYLDTVIPTFRKSKLDRHLDELKKIRKLTVADLKSILQTHHYLTATLNSITDLDKRSFSSKYLHFHLPGLFFIYDTRALSALRQFTSRVPADLKHLTRVNKADKEYAKFFCKCFDLKRRIEKHYKISLTVRQLDKILIEIANKKNVSRKNLISVHVHSRNK